MTNDRRPITPQTPTSQRAPQLRLTTSNVSSNVGPQERRNSAWRFSGTTANSNSPVGQLLPVHSGRRPSHFSVASITSGNTALSGNTVTHETHAQTTQREILEARIRQQQEQADQGRANAAKELGRRYALNNQPRDAIDRYVALEYQVPRPEARAQYLADAHKAYDEIVTARSASASSSRSTSSGKGERIKNFFRRRR